MLGRAIYIEMKNKDKGVDPNFRPEKKQVIKPLSAPVQSHVPTESKRQFHAKPGVGQGRTGIKREMLKTFPMPHHMKRHSNQNCCQEESL